MTEMEKIRLLVNSGREMAGTLLTSAVETSESEEQMISQIFVLRAAAVSILATSVYNEVKKFNCDPHERLMHIFSELNAEFEILESETDVVALMPKYIDGMTQQ